MTKSGASHPPGTSKWNKIEHRLFCHITQNWRDRPLTTRLAVVELIGATTTKTGLKVDRALDTRTYCKGIRVSKAESIDITGDNFHPEWNYTIRPRKLSNRSDYCAVAVRHDRPDAGGPAASPGYVTTTELLQASVTTMLDL